MREPVQRRGLLHPELVRRPLHPAEGALRRRPRLCGHQGLPRRLRRRRHHLLPLPRRRHPRRQARHPPHRPRRIPRRRPRHARLILPCQPGTRMATSFSNGLKYLWSAAVYMSWEVPTGHSHMSDTVDALFLGRPSKLKGKRITKSSYIQIDIPLCIFHGNRISILSYPCLSIWR